MVTLPFSSLQLNPSLAQYLELTPSQSNAIQRLMSDERRNLQPLIEQLRTTREKLLAATGSGPAKEKQVKALAARLAKLIVANSRMQARLYKLLNSGQQKKLADFKRASDPLIASR